MYYILYYVRIFLHWYTRFIYSRVRYRTSLCRIRTSACKRKRRWIMKAHTCPCHLISHFFQFTNCKLASCIHVNCQWWHHHLSTDSIFLYGLLNNYPTAHKVFVTNKPILLILIEVKTHGWRFATSPSTYQKPQVRTSKTIFAYSGHGSGGVSVPPPYSSAGFCITWNRKVSS